MAVTTDKPGPYAPASAILDLISRHRNKGLPAIVDADVLLRAGVSDSLVPRTLQAMKILDLLTEDGRPSDVFEGIRLAPSAEYQQRLAEWLNAAYADALTYVDPATDDEVAIRDAFRKYVPTGQQSRMVTLFMGLFTAAGVMPERPAAPRKQPTQVVGMRMVKTISSQRAAAARRPTPPGGASATIPGLPPALVGLLASLPAAGSGWTQDQRDKFITTFTPVLDFCFPIVETTSDPVTAETATDR